MYLQTPQIGTGEVVTAILIVALVALMVFLYKYLRKVEMENRRLEELILRRDEEWKLYWDRKYGQSYQQQYPQEQGAAESQSAARGQIPFYEEGAEERPQRATPTPATVLPPYPYPLAADGFFRVIPCPICERERGAKAPLFIVGRDPDGSYILSCGHEDSRGRLHMLQLSDLRQVYAPVVELEAAKEAVAASTATPTPTATSAKKEKKKKEEREEKEE